MPHFICPVCNSELIQKETIYQCRNGHCYDRAKGGYVNLLMSQAQKGKRHGDDKAMTLARTRFLEAGHYQCLLDTLLAAVKLYAKDECVFLDMGCGEGFYSDKIYRALKADGKQVSLMGVDISKEALKAFSKRNTEGELAVASAFKLPIANQSCDIVLSVFAPFSRTEVQRILAPGGVFIKAYPLEKHLLSLKKLIYDRAYENKLPTKDLDGFVLKESYSVKDFIHLRSNEEIRDLFQMTPYFYKTGQSDQEKLLAVAQLDTEIEFGVDVYQQ